MKSVFELARDVRQLLNDRLPDTDEELDASCRSALHQQQPPLVSDALIRMLRCEVFAQLEEDGDRYSIWQDERIAELEFENELLRLHWFNAVDLAVKGAQTTSGMILDLALNGCLSGPNK